MRRHLELKSGSDIWKDEIDGFKKYEPEDDVVS